MNEELCSNCQDEEGYLTSEDGQWLCKGCFYYPTREELEKEALALLF